MKSLLSIFLILLCQNSWGHEMWIIPQKFQPNRAEKIDIQVFIGQELQIQEEKSVRMEYIRDFNIVSRDNTFSVIPFLVEEDQPFCKITADFNGFAIINMNRFNADVFQDRKRFLLYLAEEHNFDTHKIVKAAPYKDIYREKYQRFLKTLICNNRNTEDSTYAKILGTDLEIILLENPLIEKNKTLRAKVLYNNKPLANSEVRVLIPTSKNYNTAKWLTTSVDGIIAFESAFKGVYMLSLIKIFPSKNNLEYDYESLWANYVFERMY